MKKAYQLDWGLFEYPKSMKSVCFLFSFIEFFLFVVFFDNPFVSNFVFELFPQITFLFLL